MLARITDFHCCVNSVMTKRLLIFLFSIGLFADSGVIIPAGRQQPDASVLAVAETRVEVTIDNGHATVQVRQIFENRTNGVLEGEYIFALPSRSTLSDFAVWDGVVRIPGVILERREAAEAFKRIRAQAVDPGLLETGERTDDASARGLAFTAKIFPIPAYGTKRLELEYQERLAVDNGETSFALPLGGSNGAPQMVGLVEIHVDIKSSQGIKDFALTSSAYPLTWTEQSGTRRTGSWKGSNVSLTQPLTMSWKRDGGSGLQVATHRQNAEPGFFETQWSLPPRTATTGGPLRRVVVLFDASLSVQWEALERSFVTMETVLRSLRPGEHFNVIVFHRDALKFKPVMQEATGTNITTALDFVKSQRLRAGTDFLKGLQEGLAMASGPQGVLVILSDGNANLGAVAPARIAGQFDAAWKQLEVASRPRTYVFAAGDSSNVPLLKLVARHGGLLETVTTSEPLEFRLRGFIAKLGEPPLENASVTVDAAVQPERVYALDAEVFSGSVSSWVGRYGRPGTGSVVVSARKGTERIEARTTAVFPAQSAASPHLPRLWARARVDALLEQMARDGEDKSSIEEIIQLSRKYKFVTPYTSFLAAPRALLRPRLIRPGDPVIRIHADPGIVSITAVFPFGLVKPLRYLAAERAWQTRFVAPSDLPDGEHQVRLVMRDQGGRTYEEQKSFVILSKMPEVKVRLDQVRYRAGQTMRIEADAPPTARLIVARLSGAAPTILRWSAREKASVGDMMVPRELPAGRYRLQVTAEDMAHNLSMREVMIDVVP